MAKKLPKILSDQEIVWLHRYFNTANARRAATNARDYAMVMLMLEYGLRVGEVVNLKRDDIDMQSGRLHVRGKGEQDRIIWVTSKHLPILEEWLEQRPADTPWLFCTLHSSRGEPGKPLQKRQVHQKIKRIGTRIGRPDLYPHLLRHTFGTRLYKKTKDLVQVQKILGHSNINNTRIYVTIAGDDTKKILQEYHNAN